MAYLELIDVHKSFGDDVALNGIRFDCNDGEFLCLLGPSGAGKTTTINVITGLEKVDEGQIILDGEDITEQLPQERNMAAAFESYALYPHLSVFDNIAFPLRAPARSGQFSKEEMAQQVREMSEMLAIDELLERFPRQLSGGQRQRVALGRALIRRPQLYLLDEPIAHLDAKLRHRMRGELRRIQLEFGISTIYATPDQLDALSMADRIVVLNKGNIEQIGTPDEIYSRPANTFVASFVGDPPMNIFEGALDQEGIRIRSEAEFLIPLPNGTRAKLEASAADSNLLVGFRPVDVRLVSPGDTKALVNGVAQQLDVLGQTAIVTVIFDAHMLKVKTAADDAPERDETVGIDIDTSKLYFFDTETGRALF